MADAVLDGFEFTDPVEVDDCRAVRDALRAALPDATLIEVYHTRTVVHVGARLGQRWYTREMRINRR